MGLFLRKSLASPAKKGRAVSTVAAAGETL
jgi:hypothetical protein